MTAVAITPITDHEERGIARLIERYRKPRVSALLGSWLAEAQALEDSYGELLDDVVTRQIDVQGRIVGQPREGRSDAVYLLWIHARILVNRSSGTPPQILAIARAVSAPALRLEEHYPAAIVLHSDAPFDGPSGAQLAKLLQEAKPAGVALYYHWFVGTAFRFAPVEDAVPGSPSGFGAGTFSALNAGGELEWYVAPPAPEGVLLDDGSGDPLTEDDDYLTDG
jgi:hypothetical protein